MLDCVPGVSKINTSSAEEVVFRHRYGDERNKMVPSLGSSIRPVPVQVPGSTCFPFPSEKEYGQATCTSWLFPQKWGAGLV